MSKLLIAYLIITGVGAAIALTMPSLVALGFFFLVIPGFVLSWMPSAFLYGAVFALAWFGVRAVFGEGIIAVCAGLIAIGAAAMSVTQATRQVDMDVYTRSILIEVTPEVPIELNGVVYFKLLNPKLNLRSSQNPNSGSAEAGFACDGYCLAALFTPGVTAVVIDSNDEMSASSKDARTYRLAKRPNCEPNAAIDINRIQAPLLNDEIVGMQQTDASMHLVSQWGLKLASEFCLVMGPAETAPDFRIIESSSKSGASPYGWSFGPGYLETQTVEIHAGERLVLRAHQSSMTTLSTIFHIAGSGWPDNYRFGWGRTKIRSKTVHEEIQLSQILARQTNLAGKPNSEHEQDVIALNPEMRAQLKRALSDPVLNSKSPGFQVMEAYFSAVGSNASEEDVVLIGQLLSDPRLTLYPGLYRVNLTLQQTQQVYDLYTKRLNEADALVALEGSGVGVIVKNLGRQAIELIGPEQEALLRDPVRRLSIPEMVTALGYGNPENAYTLLNILKEHSAAAAEIRQQRRAGGIRSYDRQTEQDRHIALIGAAKSGLCLLGPQASPIRDELETLLTSGAMPGNQVTGHDTTDWNVILVRMGKPVNSISKPENIRGKLANYRRNVQRRAATWKPDDC